MSSETHPLNQVTNRIPNSPTQAQKRHSNTALAPPSFPTSSRPGSLALTDSRSEGSLTEETYARCWTGKELTNRRQRTYCDQHSEMTADRLDAM